MNNSHFRKYIRRKEKRQRIIDNNILYKRIVHVDGGSFTEPPDYKFHDAYFTVCADNGELIFFAKNIGDLWSGLAEYEAIKWAIENIKERPLKITSDCSVALSWAIKGSSKKSKFRISKLDLTNVGLVFQHNNAADQWNIKNHSPKHDKQYYIKRHYATIDLSKGG